MSEVIVVGVDGSEGSRRALRWALDEAGRRRCAVEAVAAWPSRDVEAASGVLTEARSEEERRSADETLRHVVDTEVRRLGSPPPVSFELVHGDAVDVLLRTSSRAALLVVGSHGTSSMIHASLGSVSEACSRLAECPVVVLPPPAEAHLGVSESDLDRRTDAGE